MHGDIQIPGTNDESDFDLVKQSFEKLKFTLDEVDTLFSILSAILHLGNITFLGEEKVSIDPKCKSTLEVVCELLKVSEQFSSIPLALAIVLIFPRWVMKT